MHIIKYSVILLLMMTCASLQCDEHLKLKEANSIFNHIKANESDLEFSKIDLQAIQNVDYLLSGFWNGLGDLCKAYTNIAILQLNEETFRGSHGVPSFEDSKYSPTVLGFSRFISSPCVVARFK